MPLYEFRCGACERDFEQLCRGAAGQAEVTCPGCGSAEVRRKLSRFGMSSKSRGGSRRSRPSGCASCTASSCAGCRR